jgi:hypothetical protein
MRIISVQPSPVARIFALTYAVCGLIAFTQYAFTSTQIFILPIGILMGVFHLNVNFQLGRSPDLIANAFLCCRSRFVVCVEWVDNGCHSNALL